jgi:hypothetical protein
VRSPSWVLGVRLEDEVLRRYQRQQAEAAARQRLSAAINDLGAVLRNIHELQVRPQRGPEPDHGSRVVASDRHAPAPNSRAVVRPVATVPATTAPPETDAVWPDILAHPTVVVILGSRGSGKTGLGFRILDLLRYVAAPYVVGLPAAARDLVPDWIGIAPTLEDVPANAVILVDEAQLRFHSRASQARVTKALSDALSLSRQRGQTWIFVTQEGRQIDRTILIAADILILKDPGILQARFDRPELRRLVMQARDAFAAVSGERRGFSFVYAPQRDVVGLQPNALPSFWSNRLSRAFAGALPPASSRVARRLTLEERSEKARDLREEGKSYREIAQARCDGWHRSQLHQGILSRL